MLTGANQQIVTAYESEGMTPDQIAEEFALDPVAVKATLLQFSPTYRDATRKDVNGADFTDDELVEANSVIKRIMRTAESEDPNLAFRAAKYLRDDKKGRLDILSGLGKMNVNIAIFNQRLQEARDAKKLSREAVNTKELPGPPAPAIDIEAVPA